jgi:ferrochelatase
MKADGVRRAVAFTQYPQYSCATTGSSVNELWRAARRLGMEHEFQWSVIDRWPTHPGFIAEVAQSIQAGLASFLKSERKDVLLLFSAHSLPLNVVNRGDAYPQEVGASVQAVMQCLNFSNEYLLSYQSSVGPVQWLGPSTEFVVRQLGTQKRRSVLVVPIAFTSDHIETLHEIDIEYKELAEKSGITHFKRAPSLNGSVGFQRVLAEIVSAHLLAGELCSSQYRLRCPGCSNPECKNILNPCR